MAGPLVLYESRLNDAAPVASSTAASTPDVQYDVLNLRDLREYSLWKPAALPATVTVDCGVGKTADYLAIYNHNLGSSGNTVEVHRSTDNFVANDTTVDTHAPADDKPFVRLFTGASTRYWRVRIVNGSAPTLAIVLLGNRLEIPAGVREGFDPLGRELVTQINRSNTGRALGNVLSWRRWRMQMIFELVSWSWVRASWQPAAEAWLESEPWLFAWNPDAYPQELRHVTMDASGWDTPHRSGSLTDLQVAVTGVMPA
jgi:hypothetical protein